MTTLSLSILLLAGCGHGAAAYDGNARSGQGASAHHYGGAAAADRAPADDYGDSDSGSYEAEAMDATSAPASVYGGNAGSAARTEGSNERQARAEPAPEPHPALRPGLATRWGERRTSHVRTTRFQRAGSDPIATAAIHYNDARGAIAQAALRRGSVGLVHADLGRGDHRVDVSLVDEHGRALPAHQTGDRTFVVGQPGSRYQIVLHNRTPYSFEAVLSVDGLDVIDGREAAFHKRGYILRPYGTVTIDGFRQSQSHVAAFRFGSVGESYAARSTGSARNVGVVGVALFAEAGVALDLWEEAHRRDQANPFPGRYATPPPGVAY